jgi:hypothetical protein
MQMTISFCVNVFSANGFMQFRLSNSGDMTMGPEADPVIEVPANMRLSPLLAVTSSVPAMTLSWVLFPTTIAHGS